MPSSRKANTEHSETKEQHTTTITGSLSCWGITKEKQNDKIIMCKNAPFCNRSVREKREIVLLAAVSQSYSTISLKYVLQNRGVGYNCSARIIIYVIRGGNFIVNEWFRCHRSFKSQRGLSETLAGCFRFLFSHLTTTKKDSFAQCQL